MEFERAKAKERGLTPFFFYGGQKVPGNLGEKERLGGVLGGRR